MLNQARLKEFLHYNSRTGIFKWLKKAADHISPGDIAGHKCGGPKRGRISIKFGGRFYYAHRLAWFYMIGTWPFEIDHINGDPGDNRWSNLRDVSHSVNGQNRRGPQSNNATGYLGVSPLNSGKFQASITMNRKMIYLGIFKTPQEAHECYLKAKRLMHEGCTL